MNEDRPLDRRVQRTRQLLQESLLQLIIERGYESVTIQDITEQGNLGRTTFYLHYREKDELLRESIKALLYDLQCDVEPDKKEACSAVTLSIRIFQHIERRQQLYQAILKEAVPSTSLGEAWRGYFIELYQRLLEPELQAENDASLIQGEILAAHAAGSLFGLLSWWLKHELSPSAEQMGTTYLQLMTQNNAAAVFKGIEQAV